MSIGMKKMVNVTKKKRRSRSNVFLLSLVVTKVRVRGKSPAACVLLMTGGSSKIKIYITMWQEATSDPCWLLHGWVIQKAAFGSGARVAKHCSK
jgi:hypothetical protein